MLALVVYIAYTPLCWWYRKSEHHFANVRFSLLFLDVKLPDSPGYGASLGKCLKGFHLQNNSAAEKSVESHVPAISIASSCQR